jgi:hypothetical protein
LVKPLLHEPNVNALVLVFPNYADKAVPVVSIQVGSFCITPVLIPRGITLAIFLSAGILNGLLHRTGPMAPEFIQFLNESHGSAP